MSSFPKARKSNITNVSVTPEKWDAYPEVSRSTLSDSTFINLSSATQISTSTIANSTLEDLPNEAKIKNNNVSHSQVQDSAIFSSQIDRSKLENCTVTDSVVNKCTLKGCIVDPRNRVERTTASATKFMGAKVVNRSQLEDSDILSGSTVERCIVRNSVVAEGAVCDRTKMDNVAVTRSRVDRSNLSNCDVMDCVMDRTTFGWMTLRYGIWKNGDLVGRTSTTEEVVIKPRTKPMQKSADLSSSSTAEPLPVAQPLRAASPMRESGWKAAEAVCFPTTSDIESILMIYQAGEQLDDSDRINDSLSSEDEESTDDELIGAGSKSKPKAKPTAPTVHINRPASITDVHDPPPPYEA